MLRNIRIVLLNTTHPGNIGAAARAMKTMGLESLTLVAPKIFPSDEAVARAAGAEDVLGRCTVCATLQEALAPCQLAIGTSNRQRTIDWPMLEPGACAQRLVEGAAHGAVALVFGRERTGLTNAELDRCQFFTTIPTNPAFSSLNVAAAVQIMAYELMRASAKPAAPLQGSADSPPATLAEIQGYYQHLEEMLIEIGFLDPENPRKLMRRLYRLFNRAGLEQREVNILRGILTAVGEGIQRRHC